MYLIVDMVEHPIIAAVRDEGGLTAALESRPDTVFLLFGSIMTVADMVGRVHAAGKKAFLHLDLLEGIAADKSGVQHIARHVRPDGIITTRSHSVALAKDNGLAAVQRLFLIDSTAIKSGLKAIHSSGADAVEVMPGLMPGIIGEIAERTPLPIIAGGLVRTEREVLNALRAGALAVSVGGESGLWELPL